VKITATFHGIPIGAEYTKGTTPSGGPDPDCIEDVCVDPSDFYGLTDEFKEWLVEEFEDEMTEQLWNEV